MSITLLSSIIGFRREGRLRPTATTLTSVTDMLKLGTDNDEHVETRWKKDTDGWKPIEEDVRLTAPVHECHGQCYGFEAERSAWRAPRLVFYSAAEARPGYNSKSASEYLDGDKELRGKVRQLARLLKISGKTVIYAGAGLSTSAGISDYATVGRTKGQAQATLKGDPLPGPPHSPMASPLLSFVSTASGELAAALEERQKGEATSSFRSPLCAQPTLSHRVLVGLHRAGLLHRIIQQNHDGLPQKAGMPQHVVNEIHGALHSPDNPVVPMSGELRSDLFADLLECERQADLLIAVGTSLCGMNADRVVTTAAAKAPKHALGSVIIGLQVCSLRLYPHHGRPVR